MTAASVRRYFWMIFSNVGDHVIPKKKQMKSPEILDQRYERWNITVFVQYVEELGWIEFYTEVVFY